MEKLNLEDLKKIQGGSLADIKGQAKTAEVKTQTSGSASAQSGTKTV